MARFPCPACGANRNGPHEDCPACSWKRARPADDAAANWAAEASQVHSPSNLTSNIAFPQLRSGDRVGPYTLVHELGRGAFGVVWLAERRTILATTRVAVKLPHVDQSDFPAIAREKPQLWVRASGHQNVLPVFEAAVYHGRVAIVSEYAHDGSLKEWLRRHGGKAPSTEAALAMTSGILSGLKHLHERQIIHRDLKPGNILLQGETPRIADFGISRIVRSNDESQGVAGTPAYMAPEAWNGVRTESTDLWSVGVILFQMLAGCEPFPQTDKMKISEGRR